MSNKKVNMFEKAASDRRAEIADANEYVADDIMSTKVEESIPVENSLEKLINERKPNKKHTSFYIDARIHKFISEFSNFTGVSMAELSNQLLTIAIQTNPYIQELGMDDKKVRKILDEFNGSN